jgi:DNA polymerase I-like protein with 3'-5' exonuclease and polymerase domains
LKEGITNVNSSRCKALEWVCAAFLSQDETAIKEIWNNVDQHTDNQERFGLPSRLIAKTFVFRLIYGGSAYSYANDPNFKDIGGESFWENVIREFYNKYDGLGKWHTSIVDTAKRDRRLVMPTGRVYNYEPEVSYGKVKWPRTKILNYPVQGLGADLMSIARVSLSNRLKGVAGVKLINTVHDSIILDVDDNICDNISIVNLVDKCFTDVPMNFEKLFGVKFNLPMRVECQVGPDWKNMEVVNAS